MVPNVVDSRQGNPAFGAGIPMAVLRMPEGDFSEAALQERLECLYRKIGCETLARRVKVSWNYRMRTTAGLACFTDYTITLNPLLIAFGMGEVDRTLKHEMGHLLARYRAGRKRITPHGPEWKQACVDLGLTDEKRCHSLPLPRRRMQPRHLYRCGNCQAEVWRVRPFRRSVACLKCCRMFTGGRYEERFRFIKVVGPLPPTPRPFANH